MKTVSFRSSLRGEIAQFLDDVAMECSGTEKALVELVVALSHYREEGVELFPQVLVCDDVGLALRVLQGSEPIQIGNGPRSSETIRQALKKCAPLARGGWAVYLERQPSNFGFGVFREPIEPTSLSLRETITGLQRHEVNAILVMQIAEKSVELLGTGEIRLNIHLSSAKENTSSPFDAMIDLSRAITADVDSPIREPTESYLRHTLSNALQACHGTLVAVCVGEIPDSLSHDGVVFPTPIDLAAMVREHNEVSTSSSRGMLQAYASLLSGMMGTDGITVVSTDGKLLGYNFFVKPPETATSPRELVGGARRRAFGVLKSLADAGALTAAFFRSSDGAAEFYQGATYG